MITALLNHQEQLISWPDATERVQIARSIETNLGVPGGCVGLMDGFHVVLFQRPARPDASGWYNRSGDYSVNICGICDHNLRIRYLQLGHTGCEDDSAVWKSTSLFREPERAFTDQQYLLADSDYPASDQCVPLFTRLPGEADLPLQENLFNYRMARPRDKVEKCFGELKRRFTSLQGLRVRIRNAEAEQRVNDWILACVIIHNLLRKPEASPCLEGELTQLPLVDIPPESGSKRLTQRWHPKRMAVMRAMGLGNPSGPMYTDA